MPELIAPTVAVHASWLRAVAEFTREGRGTAASDLVLDTEIRQFGAHWQDADGFARYVEALHRRADEDAPRPAGSSFGTGIDDALVTCDVDNVGSRAVIEATGGVLEDVRDGKRRYWIAVPR